jgi:hypothetical protein
MCADPEEVREDAGSGDPDRVEMAASGEGVGVEVFGQNLPGMVGKGEVHVGHRE